MLDRHRIKNDEEFWRRLGCQAHRWLQSAEDQTLRRFWIDDLLPELAKNTKSGVEVEGIAWIGDGPRNQLPYRFVVSVPQNRLHRWEGFSIERLFLDPAQRTMRVEVN